MPPSDRPAPYRLTKPCASCPFRNDIKPYLRPARIREFAQGLIRSEFYCHNTVDYELHAIDDGEGPCSFDAGPNTAHCAGALILLEKLEQPSQMMRIAERLGMYDRTKLDMNAPVYDSFEEMIEAAKREVARIRSKPGRKKT